MLFIPAIQAGTLDRRQTVDNSTFALADNNGAVLTTRLAQTLTVTRTGTLDQVELKLDNGPLPQMSGVGANPLVEIYATSGGAPTGPALGSGFPTQSVVFFPGLYFRTVPIAPAVAVTPGTTYAIVVTSPLLPGGMGGYKWEGASTNVFPSGAALESLSGGPWVPVPGVSDFDFKDYIHLTAQDQAQEQDNTQGTVGPTGSNFQIAQTFTPGATGSLNLVDVKLSQFTPTFPPTAGQNITVEIRTTSAGVPTATVVGSAGTITQSQVPDPQPPSSELAAFVPVSLSGVTVTSGTQYALVLRVPSPVGQSGAYIWQGTTTAGAYAGGAALSSTNGTTWGGFGSGMLDMAFRTYINAPTAVVLSSASAVRTSRGVVVRWRTPALAAALGFNVYREANGTRAKANARLIAAGPQGSYSFVDRTAPRGAVRYWLQVVRLDGSRAWYRVGSVGRV